MPAVRKSQCIAATIAGLLLTACQSDSSTGPGDPFAVLLAEAQPAFASGLVAAGTPVAPVSVTYVSLSRGAVPSGRAATIWNIATQAVVAVDLHEGGFDPVMLPASAGDTIAVSVVMDLGDPLEIRAAVPARVPPVVVRTVPPRGGTDVPLNALMTVVFSEPMDAATLDDGGVVLLRGDQEVAAQLVLSPDGLRAELRPAATLEPSSAHTLVIQGAVSDAGGDALAEAYLASFTTENGTAPVAAIRVTPARATIAPAETLQLQATVLDSQGNELFRLLDWAVSDTMLASVDGEGRLVARRPGVIAVTASTAGVAGSAEITVGILAFQALSAGVAHSCGITTDGVAYCWGRNGRGELGDGSSSASVTPVPVAGGHRFLAIAAGSHHTCAIASDSTGWCWGLNQTGQLGDSTWKPFSLLPVPVAGSRHLRSITVGYGWDGESTCAIGSDGTAYCWGVGTVGQWGSGHAALLGGPDSSYRRNFPVRVDSDVSFLSISAGLEAPCALGAAGIAWCWGSGSPVAHLPGGEQCRSSISEGLEVTCHVRPTQVAPGLVFRSLSTGRLWACGLTEASSAWCWDYDGVGPVQLHGGLSFLDLDVGRTGEYSCGLAVQAQPYCWGRIPGPGGSMMDWTLLPAAVTGGPAFTSLTAGGAHACALTAAGVAYCWGDNRSGQLGFGGVEFSSQPRKVAAQP